jgi:predicted TPR repeat methyltransferase
VDLSEAMLERARLRGDYDNLVAVELNRFLRESREEFDVIACGDTLVYFGELREVFGGAARVLRPGRYFVFSVELLEDQENSAGYRLRPHGRYAHSESYVRQAVVECGLAVRCVEAETLRFEAGKAVEGLLVVTQKPENS